MDLLTFLSKLMWPMVVLVLLWPCRKPLANRLYSLLKANISKEGINWEFAQTEISNKVQSEIKDDTHISFDDTRKELLKSLLIKLSRIEKLILIRRIQLPSVTHGCATPRG
jgi:hypothetical protein